MSSNRVFGWDYPAGAENDPRAPWNQVDPRCEECGLADGDCACRPCNCVFKTVEGVPMVVVTDGNCPEHGLWFCEQCGTDIPVSDHDQIRLCDDCRDNPVDVG